MNGEKGGCLLNVSSPESQQLPEKAMGELVNRGALGTVPEGCGMNWLVSTVVPRGPWWSPSLCEVSKCGLIISEEGNTLREKAREPSGLRRSAEPGRRGFL